MVARAAIAAARRSPALPAATPARASAQSASDGIDVVAAEGGVAAGGDDLEHASGHAQERDVERAAAEVVDRVQALAAVVEAVGDRRRRRLGEQAQDLEPGEPPASLVAWRWASSKYAGTVMTAP